MKKLAAIALLLVCVACNRDREGTTPIDSSDTAATSGTSATAPASPAETGTLVPTDTGVATPSAISGTATTSFPSSTTATPPTTTIPTNPTTEPPPDTAPAPTAQIAAGRPIYEGKCASCHGADGRKQVGSVTLASAATQSKSDADLARTLREAPQHRNLGLDPQSVTTVVAYVKALK